MAIYISHSAEQTERLGESWGAQAAPGMLFGLCGDLGSGKTQLVKGIARGLGITSRVQSPTFALVNLYSGGRLPLFHLDIYRLEKPEHIEAAGLAEYLNPNRGVTVVEWAERWPELVKCQAKPARLRWVELVSLGEMERRITYEDFGG